jgi:phage shock protein C
MAQVKPVKAEKDRLLFGVCGGLAEYLDVDSVFVRLAFVLLAIASGLGLLAYVALVLLMPRSKEKPYDPASALRQNIQGIPGDTAEAGRRIGGVIRGDRADAPAEPVMAKPESRRTAIGIILILIGVIILIVNFGVLGWFSGAIFWPVLLIAVGLGLLAIRAKTS